MTSPPLALWVLTGHTTSSAPLSCLLFLFFTPTLLAIVPVVIALGVIAPSATGPSAIAPLITTAFTMLAAMANTMMAMPLILFISPLALATFTYAANLYAPPRLIIGAKHRQHRVALEPTSLNKDHRQSR
ncbi:MAG: hypothetical protein ACRC5V_10485 [Aeromonas sp.]